MTTVYPNHIVYATPAAPQIIQTQKISRNGLAFGFMLLGMIGGCLLALLLALNLLLLAGSLDTPFMIMLGSGCLLGIAFAVTYGKAALDKEWLLSGNVPLKLSPLIIFPAIHICTLMACFGFSAGQLVAFIFYGLWWALFSFHEPARPYRYKTVTNIAY